MGIIKRQGLKNNIITYIGVFIGFFNLIILQPYVLAPEELGLLRLLLSASVLVASIYPLGLNSFIIKYFSYFRDKDSGHNGFAGFLIIYSSILFVVCSVVLFYFKSFFISKFSNSALFVEQFYYVLPMSYFLGLFNVFTAYSFSIYKTTVPSFLNEVINRIILVVAICLYYLKLISFEWLVIIYVFSFLIILLLLFIYFIKTDKLKFSFKRNLFNLIPKKEAIRFSVVMGVTSLAYISLRNIDSIFIASYKNLSDVAVYSVAFTICTLIDVPGNALSKIVVPKIADAFKSNNLDYVKELYYQSNRITVIAGAFLFLLMYTNADSILYLLPEKYHNGVVVLKIIAASSFVNMITGFNMNLIQYSPYYIVGSITIICLAFLSAMFNVFLIPQYGIEGAAISTALSILIVNGFTVLYIYYKYQMQAIRLTDVYIIGFTIALVIVNSYLPTIENNYLSIIIKSICITTIFYIVVIAFDLIPEAKNMLSLSEIKKLFGKNKQA
jgi:O-antigen/teichoic acid export membrane protein